MKKTRGSPMHSPLQIMLLVSVVDTKLMGLPQSSHILDDELCLFVAG